MSFTARPAATGAGPITATRRPPRVTTMVSPCSASSRTAAKRRDASVAVITFTTSDYQMPRAGGGSAAGRPLDVPLERDVAVRAAPGRGGGERLGQHPPGLRRLHHLVHHADLQRPADPAGDLLVLGRELGV